MKKADERWRIAIPQQGDLIRSKIDSFYHFGICIGNNSVVHYSTEGKFSILNYYKMEVCKSDFNSFSQGNKIEIRIFNEEEKTNLRSVEEIVKDANSKLGDKDYDLLFNNCEHFAYECCFGIGQSELMSGIVNTGLTIRRTKGFIGFIDSLNQKLKRMENY